MVETPSDRKKHGEFRYLDRRRDGESSSAAKSDFRQGVSNSDKRRIPHNAHTVRHQTAECLWSNDEKSVLLNHNVRIHLPAFIKLPLRFEYEGVEGYNIICVSDSISHSGDQTIEQANEGALGELRPTLRFHLPKTLAEQFTSLKVEFELINRQKLSALIAPTQLF